MTKTTLHGIRIYRSDPRSDESDLAPKTRLSCLNRFWTGVTHILCQIMIIDQKQDPLFTLLRNYAIRSTNKYGEALCLLALRDLAPPTRSNRYYVLLTMRENQILTSTFQ